MSKSPEGPQQPKDVRRQKPPWPESGPAVALAFSGGGFRASLAGMGMLRAVADARLLGNVRYASSVSGGSWPNAILATQWRALEAGMFTTERLDELVLRPFVDTISTKSLTQTMARNAWRILGRKTRTDLLADAFDDWFGHGMTLGELPDNVRWMFNATNLTNGARFEFERERIGDNQCKYIRAPSLRLADALGASASLPGALATQRLRTPYNVYPRSDRPKLVDGAVYDNLGIEPLHHIRDKPLIVVLDAGAPLKKSVRENLGIVGTVKKSTQISARQTTTLRKRWFIDELRTWEDWEAAEPGAYRDFVTDQAEKQAAIDEWTRAVRSGEIDQSHGPRPSMPPPHAKRGVIFGLDTTMDNSGDITNRISKLQTYAPDPEVPEVPPWRPGIDADAFRTKVTTIPMRAGRFKLEDCDDLIYRGWWLTRETLRTFHPDALRAGMPVWTHYR